MGLAKEITMRAKIVAHSRSLTRRKQLEIISAPRMQNYEQNLWLECRFVPNALFGGTPVADDGRGEG